MEKIRKISIKLFKNRQNFVFLEVFIPDHLCFMARKALFQPVIDRSVTYY